MVNNQAAMLNIRTPLIGQSEFKSEDLHFYELPLAGKLSLRGGGNINGKLDEPAPEFQKAVKKALGADYPISMDKGEKFGTENTIYQVSFDEWLIFSGLNEVETIKDSLTKALSKQHHAIVEVSDYYTEIMLEGNQARELLSFGVSLDLSDKAFPIGKGCFTNWHHANIFLSRHGENAYKIAIRWSFSAYLYAYLKESAKEICAIYSTP